MDQTDVPLDQFYSKLIPAARGAGFKLVITAAAREADAPDFFNDVKRYWTSLDDATGPDVLVLFAGVPGPNQLGETGVVHYSRNYQFNAHCYKTQGLAMTGKAAHYLDWNKGDGPPTCGILGVDAPTERFVDEHSREMYRFRRLLGLSEDQLPILVLTLLPQGKELQVLVPFAVMGNRTFYQYIKELSGIWENAFDQLSELESQREAAQRNAKENQHPSSPLSATKHRLAAFVKTAEDAQAADLILKIMELCGSRGRVDKQPCWALVEAIKSKNTPRAIMADIRRMVDLSFLPENRSIEFEGSPYLDVEQFHRQVKECEEMEMEIWSALAKDISKFGATTGQTQIKAWDYFIVYSSKDFREASILHKMLEKRGNTFFDRTCIRPGESFPEVIGSALDKSKCVVVLVTSGWQGKPGGYYTAEYVRALDSVRNGKQRIVPILLGEEASIPYGLEHYHALRVQDIDEVECHMPL